MKRFFLLITSFIMLTTIGCKKAEIEGCTNSSGINYTEEATIDDGSCRYDYFILFSLSEQGYNTYVDSGISSLDIEVEGLPEILNSVPLIDFYTNGSDCQIDLSTIIVTENMVDSNLITTCKVRDNNEIIRLEKTILIGGGGCTKVNIDL